MNRQATLERSRCEPVPLDLDQSPPRRLDLSFLTASKERLGNRLLIVAYMYLHSSITNSPSGSGQTVRTRHLAAWLFVGWSAFWLAAVITPCCTSQVANAQAGQESTAIEYRVQAPTGDEQHELPCPDLSHAQAASPALTVVSFDRPSKAISPPPLLAALHLFPVVARVKPHIGDPRPSVPFHQRTARLLI